MKQKILALAMAVSALFAFSACEIDGLDELIDTNSILGKVQVTTSNGEAGVTYVDGTTLRFNSSLCNAVITDTSLYTMVLATERDLVDNNEYELSYPLIGMKLFDTVAGVYNINHTMSYEFLISVDWKHLLTANDTVGNMFVIKFDQDGNYVKHLVSEGEATQENVRALKVVGNKLYMATWIAGVAGTEFSIGGKSVIPATVNGSWALAELDTNLNVNWLQFYESTISGSAWQMPTMTIAGDHIYLMGTAKYGYTIGETNYTNTPANKARQSWLMQFDRSNGNATAATVLATGNMQMQHGFFGGYEGTDGNFYAIERGLTPSASFGSEMILYKFNQETLEIDDNVQLAQGSCDGQSLVTDGTKVYVMNRFGNKNEAISFYNSEITFSSLSFVWGQSAYEVPVGAVQSLTIEGNSEINLEKGKSIDLVASLIPEDPANSEIIWSSSNEEAVTVDENGKITAVNDQKAGGDNAIITATSASNPSVKASVKVNVTNVTAIGTVNSAKAVKTVRYYNVAGVESNVPFSGMNIIVKTYSDGSRETTKAVK